MINAVFYSDQVISANEKVDIRLTKLMRERGRRIGYVPSGPDPDLWFYSEKRAYYARQGLDLDIFYDLDRDHDSAERDALLACDAIHLSGGNTAAFLARLRRSGMLDRLRNWANDGGLLVGTSAGAILMTPTIAVDALFSNKRPEDAKDSAALDLVPFEFFPHVQAKPSYLPDLLAYSTWNSRPIIACPDGDGVVVADGVVECIGDPFWLSNGSVERVRETALAALRP
ncbi:Type 1 glutamine amidotransferase-like domain-containing protein [Mesorhizobium sp. AR10]|uniref:Type 1 glutamine amidotransferase-like domain-containing protein n=1 Tax=Mesorhizobium sp. AR10 TaxID=2865839 RepID=UPI002200D610|nr:Type 1 glutamine amidotransferase-like domain-containing protein [Mesorhizobium sp. AR10]